MNFTTLPIGAIIDFNGEAWRFTSIGVTLPETDRGALTLAFKKANGEQLPPGAPVLMLDATHTAQGRNWVQDSTFWSQRGPEFSMQINCTLNSNLTLGA